MLWSRGGFEVRRTNMIKEGKKPRNTIGINEQLWKIIAKNGKFAETPCEVLLRLLKNKKIK